MKTVLHEAPIHIFAAGACASLWLLYGREFGALSFLPFATAWIGLCLHRYRR